MQLNKRLCPSVGPWVRWFVSPSVRHAFLANREFEGFQINSTNFKTFCNYWPVGLVCLEKNIVYIRIK